MPRGRFVLGLLLALALAVPVAACSGDTGAEIEGSGEPQPLDMGLALAASASVLDLAVDLEQQLALASPSADLVVAPLPVATSLTQIRAGATGATAEALDAVLHPAAVPSGPANLASGVSSLGRLFEEQTGVQTSSTGRTGTVSLDVADSLWFQKGTPLSQTWLDGLASTWGSGVRTTDFRSEPEAARRAVNTWISGATSDHIDQLAPRGSVSASTRLMGAGAAYLKAPWSTAFAPIDTRLVPFRHLDGSTTTVSMMQNPALAAARHGDGDGWVAVELPYLGRMSMTFIVPDEGRFTEVEQRLDGSQLTDLVGVLHRGTLDLSLPRFGFTTDTPLTDALRDLGLGPAMDPTTADFSGISAEQLWLGSVLHQTYLSIAEQGTEATATNPPTSDTTRPRPRGTTPSDTTPADDAGPSADRPTSTTGSGTDVIVVNRPFLVLVRDRATGAPLFYGRVLSPNG